eukprot:scaffold660_cov134-Isochrysis_galbana.AAC.3
MGMFMVGGIMDPSKGWGLPGGAIFVIFRSPAVSESRERWCVATRHLALVRRARAEYRWGAGASALG